MKRESELNIEVADTGATAQRHANSGFLATGAGLAALGLLCFVLHPGFTVNPGYCARTLEVSPVLSHAPESVSGLWRALADHPALAAPIYAALVLGMAGLQWRAMNAARHATVPIVPIVAVGFAVAATLAVVAAPIQSTDIFYYLAHAELMDEGLNPYTTRPFAYPDLPALRFRESMFHGSIYGPASTRLFSLLYFPALGVAGFLLAWRCFLAILTALTLLLLGRCWRALGRAPPERAALLVMVAWSPLILIDGIANGHVDVVAAFLLAAGCWQLLRGRELVGLTLLASTVAVKITFAVLLPAVLMRAVLGAGSTRRGLVRASAVAAGAVAFYAAWLVPFSLSSSLGPLAALRDWTSNSLAGILRAAAHPIGLSGLVLPLSRLALVLVLFSRLGEVADRGRFLRRLARDLLLYVVVFGQVYWSWYLIPALVLVVLADDARLRAAVLLLAATSLAGIHVKGILHRQDLGAIVALYAVTLLPATVLLLLPRPLSEKAPAAGSRS